ncbi:MAG: GatB/YqeY domain-containing protein [Chloroflexi bacterium]|nr:GatB/YqeY domain-containing protein [Chloroflexota bacterium]
MSLQDRLQEDLKAAMRAKDAVRVSTIRLLRAAITSAEQESLRTALNKERAKRAKAGVSAQDVELEPELVASLQRAAALDDAGVMATIRKEAKRRREAMDQFRAGSRADLAAKEEAELAILEEYLPAQLGEADVEKVAREVIASTGASDPKDTSKVMRPLMSQLRDQADGQLVSKVVQRLLSGQ